MVAINQTDLFKEIHDTNSLPFLKPSEERKVCLISGANSGIGFFATLHLYLHGWVIYMACRNEDKTRKAIIDIETEAKKRVQDGSISEQFKGFGEMKFIRMDLTSFESVQKAANEYLSVETSLDLLINNAGVMALPHIITDDGYEIQFQTNYLSMFLLTMNLLDVIKQTPNSRVVYVSSIGHYFAFRKTLLINTFNWAPNFISTWFRYGYSKVYGMHLMKYLSRKVEGDNLFMSVHPGFIMNTGLYDYWLQTPYFGGAFSYFLKHFGNKLGLSNEEGCMPLLKAALSPALGPSDNGKYFAEFGRESPESKLALNENASIEEFVWALEQLQRKGYLKDTKA
ncbi:NAD(P)-binding protein [Nadsonia fulvescens var. elongata DSM 6958]|uniref:NAD(P)-binding protein n=1 Tax=Nadsonia fulvescens var. elongata DSM 6958 TaxID=857566 RepID=A0A1E3PPL4_9ASCO|nr:NAD(P)-binding protein [Nadsonia fulvescens var. elongata DSM 6958]